MLMPTIALFLLEASLLMSGLPGAQVCQEILTITVPFKEGKIYVCNKCELPERIRPHSWHSVNYNSVLHNRPYMGNQKWLPQLNVEKRDCSRKYPSLEVLVFQRGMLMTVHCLAVRAIPISRQRSFLFLLSRQGNCTLIIS